jgi:hypothetical protein
MLTTLDSAKNILQDELLDASHVKENLYGSAACSRKIENYIIESVKSGVNQCECLDWLVNLLKANNVTDFQIQDTKMRAELQYSILDRFVS